MRSLLRGPALGRIDEQLAVYFVNGPGLQRFGARRFGGLPTANVEPALMKRALDLTTHEKSLGQGSRTMGALILRDVIPIVATEHRVGNAVVHGLLWSISRDVGRCT
jgi:hypothetical protein